jgi:hypothetical protein
MELKRLSTLHLNFIEQEIISGGAWSQQMVESINEIKHLFFRYKVIKGSLLGLLKEKLNDGFLKKLKKKRFLQKLNDGSWKKINDGFLKNNKQTKDAFEQNK